MADAPRPDAPKKSLILCFDGTGNKFSGTPSDSNIVKIFSLLDREDPYQAHYYQPGIGTYVETSSLAQKSRFGRIKSWYIKAKDEAIGTSFGEHVMAGYKFLMRYYSAGDDIYFFGFSRGAYTARFLAELLDYIGLLSAGNEEMLRFAWKTFALWQMRTEETEEERKKKAKTFVFMKKFRETFSRPIDRIRFIGLFDCVNSVPQFESAWMSRTKFPYTAKTSAMIIRHAVSIDERRTKFRQDLLSGRKFTSEEHSHHFHAHHHNHDHLKEHEETIHLDPESVRYRRKPRGEGGSGFHSAAASISGVSASSQTMKEERLGSVGHAQDAGVEDENDPQDILEVWFAGQHGDIGGGWTLDKDEKYPSSDLPLMWMLREARRAGMPFDEEKIRGSGLFPEGLSTDSERSTNMPLLQLDGQPLTNGTKTNDISHEDMMYIHTKTKIHDSLAFGGGLPTGAVLAWQFMEHLPFRRMDLQSDGTWKPISWPLPRGEVRDIPGDAIIHGSVIRRMKAREDYRPGNVIVGGGGRGMRRAPESAGIGQWKVVREEGDLLGEVYIKQPVESGEKK